MSKTLKGRDFLKLQDFTEEELYQILDTANYLKIKNKVGMNEKLLQDKNLAMIFEKPSTRTRVSFETGINQLGGKAMFLSSKDIQLGRGETIADTAKVLSRYVDAIMIRTFGHEIVEELAEHASIPVINGLTDTYHPCQIIGDFMTIREKFNKLEGLKICYAGDGSNVANSLLIGAAMLGINISLACPEGYQPDEKLVKIAKEYAAKSGATIEVVDDLEKAVQAADVVYTDIWVSMGKEDEKKKRLEDLKKFQITKDIMEMANKDAIFMHCLPAHRGEEMTEEVIDGKWSVVFDQAENRLHAQKSIMALLIK